MTVSRVVGVALVLLAASVVRAAPAPFAKPDRGGPTEAKLIAELRQAGIDVRQVEAEGRAGWWKVCIIVPVELDVGGDRQVLVVRLTHVVSVQAPNARAALRTLRKQQQGDLPPIPSPPPPP